MSPFMHYSHTFDAAYEATQQLKPKYKRDALDRLEVIMDELLNDKDYTKAALALESLTNRINLFPRRIARTSSNSSASSSSSSKLTRLPPAIPSNLGASHRVNKNDL